MCQISGWAVAINLLSAVPDRDRDRDGAADTAAAARMSVAKTVLQTISSLKGDLKNRPEEAKYRPFLYTLRIF